MIKELVSIIIPTFNRAHLISETLDSIIAQTYENWECIIVDDSSTDNTEELVKKYATNDSRFKYFKRPEQRLKGANACRNYGFEKSSGKYINWFDDDDIMLSQKIEKQLHSLKECGVQFTISRFDNFDEYQRVTETAFDKNINKDLNLHNYLSGKVFWGTIDFLGSREILIESSFNDILKSGQEYNFFISVMVNNKIRGYYLNEVLSLRRIHKYSIQQIQKNIKLERLKNKFNVYWITYIENKDKLDWESLIFLLQKATLYNHKLFLNGVIIISLPIFIEEISKLLGQFKGNLTRILFIIANKVGKGDLIGSIIIKRIFKI